MTFAGIACPVCGQVQTSVKQRFLSPQWTTERFSVRGCPDCGLLFTHPQPSAQLLTRLYQSPAYQQCLGGEEHAAALLSQAQTYCQGVRQVMPAGTILEVGCGGGFFLQAAREAGYRIFGVEADQARAGQAAQRSGAQVIANDFMQVDFRHCRVDAVVMWDVFEHLAAPDMVLEHIRRMLRPGGYFMTVVPDAGSPEIRHFGAHWVGWWVPLHLYH